MEEAKSINLSLSALGNVFNALSTGASFIPYNDNKLTQLMRDSLGNNAKTLMFVNLSPAGELSVVQHRHNHRPLSSTPNPAPCTPLILN